MSFQPTACILCSINCGIEVEPIPDDNGGGGRLGRIRGDRAHPGSAGYTCEKALRLDHYQRKDGRLDTPLRRRDDGTFEPIDWDTAISEIAARFKSIREQHGGETIFYYGGGGQGNHLGGAHGTATRAALGSVYASNALAQEKTGEFWVDGQLFGRPRCHTTGDFEHAEVAVFVGKNPWHSHGFPRARVLLKEISKDPNRALIVIDPRRTETAELADYHLQVLPGTDAWCLSAILAVLVEEDLLARDWLAAHAGPWEPLREALSAISIAQSCARSGVEESLVREVARRIARAGSVSMFEDLGIQQSPNSTLCSYLEKLIYLFTGNFAKRGGMNIHSRFASLGGGGPGGGGGGSGRVSPVGGHRIITGLVPCNVIPDEILTDHPKRFRAMLVESANPAHSLADSPRMREALSALELLVVIDVALTETGRLAHYILPAPSQFEKWEATFFNLEFPNNVFQLRAPVLPPLEGTLPEPEIHARLVRALGVLPDEPMAALAAAAKEGRHAFAPVFFQYPELMPYAPVVLHETLGPTLPRGAKAAAAIWALSHTCAMTFPDAVRRAGIAGEGPALGEALFEAILQNPSGLVFTADEYEETWRRVETPGHRINLVVPLLLDELRRLPAGPAAPDTEYPFVLAAGERRTDTANTIYRAPDWSKNDDGGALRMNPRDADRLGVRDGDRVRISTRRGSAVALVERNETLREGHVTLPNGRGRTLSSGSSAPPPPTDVAPNELTSGADRDPIAGTPFHKHVRARIELVSSPSA